MNGRAVKFRKSVVGGFDRHDVMSYIKTLADERNELRAQLMERRASEEETNLAARREAYASHRREFESAEELLRELEAKHEEIGQQILELREHLSTARDKLKSQ